MFCGSTRTGFVKRTIDVIFIRSENCYSYSYNSYVIAAS